MARDEYQQVIQINSPYFKKRDPNGSCHDRIVIKLNHFWYIQNWRSIYMKMMALITSLLSILILVIELQFYFDNFDKSYIYTLMFDVKDYPFFI